MERLDLLPEDADLGAVLAALKVNTKATQQGVDKLGVNLLFSKQSRVAQSITSGTYGKLTEWQLSMVTSGGLIGIFFNPLVVFSGVTLSIRLLLNDTPAKEVFFDSADNTGIAASIPHFVALNKGKHTVKFEAKVNTGTGVVGNASYDSSLYIVELLKG